MAKWIYHMIPFLLIGLTSINLTYCHSAHAFPPGGYPYPDKVEDKDTNFYFYPIKDRESKRDSFRDSFDYLYFQAFHEPNLSQKPQSDPVFRLIFAGFHYSPIIIYLGASEITVKVGGMQDIYGEPDTNKLTPLERMHLWTLKKDFPIEQAYSHKNDSMATRRRHRLDSLTTLYPQLYDPVYYKYLLEKERVPPLTPFKYSTNKIKITPSKYDSLIRLINASGYWKLPFEIKCSEETTDGFGYTLEANTADRYNIVQAGTCKNDSDRFALACQELINVAGLKKEINLIWDGTYTTVQTVLPEVKSQEVKYSGSRKHKKSPNRQ